MSDPKPRKAGAPKGPASAALQLARRFNVAFAEAIAPLGLAPAQFLVLRELWKADGLTQSELTRRLAVEQATMANTLKRMARDELILREPRPDDKRAQTIRLSSRARELEPAAKAAVKAVNARAVAGLSRKEQKRFLDLSRRMIAALRAPIPAATVARVDRPDD